MNYSDIRDPKMMFTSFYRSTLLKSELVGSNHRHLSIDFNCCLLCARFHITIKLRFKQKGVQMQSRLLH